MPCEVLSNVDNLTIRTWLTRSLRHRISAGTHMRTENVAAFEKIAFSAQSAIIGIYRIQREESSHPRPPRCRRICGVPQVDTFCPNGCENTEPILLTLDEYEVIRLVDLEQQTHEQCAAQMDISRSTLAGDLRKRTEQDRSVSCPRETAAHHRGKLPHLRRTGGSSLRLLLPDAESQHGKIRQNLQRRFHYENCSYL